MGASALALFGGQQRSMSRDLPGGEGMIKKTSLKRPALRGCLSIVLASLATVACSNGALATPVSSSTEARGAPASETPIQPTPNPDGEGIATASQVPMESTSTADETGIATVGPGAMATPTDLPTPFPDIWQPPPGTSWQWQLDGRVDLSVEAEVFDIDLFDNGPEVIEALHALGRKAICYISVGSWEAWRPDAERFPKAVLGKQYVGWAGERWLDIRQIDLLAPIMLGRLDLCQQKGFDGVEPDNMDGYLNRTGFPLTYEDQLAYNLWLAEQAHMRGLSVGMKNAVEMVEDLQPFYDWAITEECFVQGWCEQMLGFVEAGKAVFAAEYRGTGVRMDEICAHADFLSFSLILKDWDLDAYRRACSAVP